MLRFQTISQLFWVDGSGPHLGQAIASEEAFYLVTALEPFNLKSLFNGRIMKRLSGDSSPFQIPLSALPDAVVNDSAWPVKTNDGFVCVLDRKAVSRIRCSLAGSLRISTLEHFALITTGITKRHWLLRTLRELGWDV